MTRSLKVRTDWIEKIKLSLKRNGIPNQKYLATEVGLAISTVNNFLNGKAVDYASFKDICDCLNVDWQTVADWGNEPDITQTQYSNLNPSVSGVGSASVYIQRPPIEERCLVAILQPHNLIRIKSPRQMGKTMLIDYLLDHATQQGYRAVKVNLQSADEAVFTDLDALLRWLCNKVSRKFQLNMVANDYWSDIFGSKDNCTAFFEEQILPVADVPLVLALDDVDRVFEHPQLAADFFGLLRSWYEESGMGQWAKLRMLIAHSTEIYVPLRSDESPFNVGLPIELPELTGEQVQDLVIRHVLPWTPSEISLLMEMVGGHPYLISLAIDHIQQHQISLADFLALAPTEAAPYGNHLRSLRNSLKRQPALWAALPVLMQSEAAVEIASEVSFQLCSMGLAIRQGNQITLRCRLYRLYFSSRGNA
jgi:transcriptional regulator with XRE-family HTH domain